METFEYAMRVPFYDVDSMRVVYHGNYVKYLEEARCAYLEAHGLSYLDMEAAGFLLPVVSLDIKYLRPCHFRQHLRIAVTCDKSNRNLLALRYRVMDAESRQLCLKASSRQAAIGRESRELLFELPEEFLKRLNGKEWL